MFKIGDRVRLKEDYMHFKKGFEGTIHHIEARENHFVTGEYESTLVSFRNAKGEGTTCFNGRLELLPTEEPQFKVGGKYTFMTSPTIYTCEAVIDGRPVLSWLKPDGSKDLWIPLPLGKNKYKPYVPKKIVQRTGWIRIFPNRKYPDKVGSIIYPTEEEALKLSTTASRKNKNFFGVKACRIEWSEEIAE